MTSPYSPERWANDITVILNTAYGSGADRFPVDVPKISQEISRTKFPEDPITLVKGDSLPNFDGALFHSGKGWGIIYNNAIASRGRINFTLAHEFGHYLLHREDYPEGFKCNSEDMIRWDTEYGQIERQANTFAATLLMPFDDFRKQIGAKEKPTSDEIRGCAERYQASLTATTLRWLEYTERRSMIVVSRDGCILWARSSTPAVKTGLFFKTTNNSPIDVPEASPSAGPELSKLKNETIKHDAGVWFAEPCEEITLICDRYDFVTSLIHFDDAPTYMNLLEEPEEDTFDKISKQMHGSS